MRLWYDPSDSYHRRLLTLLNAYGMQPRCIISGATEPVLEIDGLFYSGYTNIYYQFLMDRIRSNKEPARQCVEESSELC